MPIHYTKRDSIARIELDNPPVNVFNPELHKDFLHILKDFVADESIHVGIWSAAGDRAFCAGDDIKSKRPQRSTAELVQRELGTRHDGESLEYPGWEREVLDLVRYKPIVGAVNGHCLGQGFIYLMLLTDVRIASTNATFGLPEIAYGMGGAGGMLRLSRLIPHTSAMWLLLTGDRIDAREAHTHHIVNEVVDVDELEPRAHAIAEKIAAHPPIAVRTEMEAYYRASEMTPADARAFTAHLYRLQRLAMDPTPPLANTERDETDND